MSEKIGFRWIEGELEWNLLAPSGVSAATVFKNKDVDSHNWFVWDECGTGGENSSCPTIDQAKIEAEAATLRWGRHF